MPHQSVAEMSPEMQECITNCLDCHTICLDTISHCLQMGGPHAEASHIRLLMDCAQICQTSADFMIRMSDVHPQTCGVCADVCERCAIDCERFGNDKTMMDCAAMCRKCADSCSRMAGMSGHMGGRMAA